MSVNFMPLYSSGSSDILYPGYEPKQHLYKVLTFSKVMNDLGGNQAITKTSHVLECVQLLETLPKTSKVVFTSIMQSNKSHPLIYTYIYIYIYSDCRNIISQSHCE